MATFSEKAAEWRHQHNGGDHRVSIQQSSPTRASQFGVIGNAGQQPGIASSGFEGQGAVIVTPVSPASQNATQQHHRDGNSSGHGTLGAGSNTRESNLSVNSWRAGYGEGPSGGPHHYHGISYHHHRSTQQPNPAQVQRQAYTIAGEGLSHVRYPTRPTYNIWSNDYFTSTTRNPPGHQRVTSLFDEDDENISTTAALNALDAMPFKPNEQQQQHHQRHEKQHHQPDISSTKASGGSPKPSQTAVLDGEGRQHGVHRDIKQGYPQTGDAASRPKNTLVDENESQWPSSISTDHFSQDPAAGTDPSTSRANPAKYESPLTSLPVQVSNEEPSPGSSSAGMAPARTLITKYTLGGQHTYCAQNNEQFPVEHATEMMRSNNSFHHIPAVCSTTVYPHHSMSSPESKDSFPMQQNVSILSSANTSDANNIMKAASTRDGLLIQKRSVQPVQQIKPEPKEPTKPPGIHKGSVEKPALLEPCYSIEVLCRDYLRGSCKRKRCRFSHPSQEELTNSVSALVQCDDNTRRVLQLSSSKKHPNQNGDPNHVWCGDEKVQAHYRSTGQIPLCYLRNWLKACSLSLQKERDQKLTTICDPVGQNIHMVERDLMTTACEVPVRQHGQPSHPPQDAVTMAAGATAATENALRRQQRSNAKMGAAQGQPGGQVPAHEYPGFVPPQVQHMVPQTSVPLDDFRKLYFAYETSIQRISVLEQKCTELDSQLQTLKLAFSHSIGLNSALQSLNKTAHSDTKMPKDYNHQASGLTPKYGSKHQPRDKQARDNLPKSSHRNEARGKRITKLPKDRKDENGNSGRRPDPSISRSNLSQAQSGQKIGMRQASQCQQPTMATQTPISTQVPHILSAPVPSGGTATLRTGQVTGATLLVNLEEINIIKSTKAIQNPNATVVTAAPIVEKSPVKIANAVPMIHAAQANAVTSHARGIAYCPPGYAQQVAQAAHQIGPITHSIGPVTHPVGPPMLSTPAIQTTPIDMCRAMPPRMHRVVDAMVPVPVQASVLGAAGFTEAHSFGQMVTPTTPMVPVMSGSTMVTRPPPSIFTPVNNGPLGHTALTASALSVVAGAPVPINLAQAATIPVHPIATAPIQSSMVANVLPPPGIPETTLPTFSAASVMAPNVGLLGPQDLVGPSVVPVPHVHGATIVGNVGMQATQQVHSGMWPN